MTNLTVAELQLKSNITKLKQVFSTHHARALGKLLLCRGLRNEGLNLVGRIVAGVEVGSDHCLDDLGVICHLRHHAVLHVLESRGLHGGGYLGLLPLRNTSKSNS